ncbi:ABC-2 type transporter [compost metagenome]
MQQLGLMIQWQLRRITDALPLLVILQIMLAVATIAGYGLLVGNPDRLAELYLATGAPTTTLITVGLVLVPQLVSRARLEGSLDWLRTLPVPREMYLFSDLAVWTIIALPGLIVGIIAGSIRFGVELTPTLWLIPIAFLVSLTAASIGYALTLLLSPTVAQLASQVLVFTILLFTPISFPPERMPDWAQQIHSWLPLQPMAEAMRSALLPNEFSVSTRSWVVLLIWCVASLAAAEWSLRRRG